MRKNNPKNILFLAHEAAAYGANQSLINMISGLVEKGFFVTTVFPKNGSICEIFKEKGWKYYVINFRTELVALPTGMIEKSKNVGRVLLKKWVNFKATKTIRQIIIENEVQILHSNSSVISIGYKVANLSKILHVWHLRELIHPNYGLHIFGGVNKYIKKIGEAQNLIAITTEVAKKFNATEHCLILNDAVRKEARLVRVDKEKYFLFCAYLHKNKGIEEALEAFYEFSLAHPDYKLYLAGEAVGDYKLKLESLISQWRIKDKVVFLGFRSNIDELMSKATAFLMCSRNEAMGRVTVEAMLNFCIVLGYNDAGTAELIKHNETGLLYKDRTELVEYMCMIADKKLEVSKIENRAHQFASNNFLEEIFANRLINYYKNLI